MKRLIKIWSDRVVFVDYVIATFTKSIMVDGSSCSHKQLWVCLFLPSVSLSRKNNNVLVQEEKLLSSQ